MRRLAVLLLSLSACDASDQAQQWAASRCRIEIFEQSRFTLCEPGSAKLRLIAAAPDSTPMRGFADVMTKIPADQVMFAMNAGMFDSDGRPIGLAIVDGRQVHAINRRDGGGNFHLKPNGVFLVRKNGEANVVTSGDFALSPDITLATQSGPMLVVNGVVNRAFDRDGTSRYIRNGVGIGPGGKPLFVISNEVVSFGKLARFFRDHLKARNALYFDGSVSSLWDPAAGRQDAGVPLGPIIVAMKPAPATRPAESAPGRAGRATP